MKDKFGNPCNPGDLILVRITQDYIIGELIEEKPGGMVIGGTDKNPIVRAPEFRISCAFVNIPGQTDFFRLVDPKKDVIIPVKERTVS